MIFNEFFIKQIPALLIIIPMFSSILSLIISNRLITKFIFFVTNFLLLLISGIGIAKLQSTYFYVFGGWNRPFGIELKYDYFAGIISFTLALIFWLFSIGIIKSSKENLDDLTKDNRSHIPYSLMLLIESAYYGLMLTNDIFNLYVFLEIASLSSYPLIVIGFDKKRFIYGFEYLMIGTLSATAMLLSIGIIFSQVGSLNFESIREFYNKENTNIILVLSLFLIGSLTKLAVFPLHGWKINAYRSTSIIVTAFFFASSPIIFISMFYKFKDLFINSSADIDLLTNIIASLTLVFGAYFAYKQEDYLKLIILSSVASTGYYLILQPLVSEDIIFTFVQLIIIDSLVKFSLIMVPIALNIKNYNINFLYNLVKKNRLLSSVLLLTFFNASALPPSVLFFNKLRVLVHLAKENFIIIIIPVALSSFMTAMYFIKIIKQMLKTDIAKDIKIDNFALSSIILSSLILVFMLFKTKHFETLSKLIFIGI